VVQWSTANAVSASINGVAVATSGSTSTTINATTTFTIRAVAADGRAATASATVTPVNTSTAPGVPRSLTSSVSGSAVTLGWQPPSTGGGASNYLVYVGTASGWSDVINAYNVGNTLRVSGSLGRGTYYARVRAANAAGTSLSSNEVSFRIGRRLRTPTAFTVSWQGSVATLSWTAGAADTTEDVPTNYVLEAGTGPGLRNVAALRVGNVTRYSTPITAGTYYVRVRAENEYGDSEPSNEIELRAAGSPQAPTNLIAGGSGATVDLRWTAPTGGYPETGYIIEAGSAPGLSDLATIRLGDVTRFTTTAPPGVYYVRVRAVNASGAGYASNEIVVRR
jgi:predicted phage tail protein